jgi:hypothetical protein
MIFFKTYRDRAVAAVTFSQTCCNRAAMDISDISVKNILFNQKLMKKMIYHRD